jgi:hypothetical protein
VSEQQRVLQLTRERETLAERHDALPATQWVERTRLLVLIQNLNKSISKLRRDAR